MGRPGGGETQLVASANTTLRFRFRSSVGAFSPPCRRWSSALTLSLVLAPAVGLTAAALSVVTALVSRPAPHIVRPEEVVEVEGLTTIADAEAFARKSRTLQLAYYKPVLMDIDSTGVRIPVRVECASAGYLPLLGPQPALGTFFNARNPAGTAQATVIGMGFARRRFGDPGRAIGSVVVLRRRPYVVLGVAPAGFAGAGVQEVDAWITFAPESESCSDLGASPTAGIRIVGRLRSGFDLGQAAADVLAFDSSTPQYKAHQRVVRLVDSARSALQRQGDLLAWLLGGAFAVLLIALSNAVGLRAIDRIGQRRETAVRMALGESSQHRLTRILTQSVGTMGACSISGGVAAALMHRVLMSHFARDLPPASLGRMGWALVATFAIGATLLADVVPIIASGNGRLTVRLGGHESSGRVRGRLGRIALIGQLSVGLGLLLTGEMFGRSVAHAKASVGFDLDHLVAITVDPYYSAYEADAEAQLPRDVLSHVLSDSPGIRDVALASYSPLGTSPRMFMMLRPSIGRGSVVALASVNAVSPNYFRATGAVIVNGRPLTQLDGQSASLVVVMPENVAHKLWNTADVIGRCVYVGGRPSCVRVVGVSRPLRSRSISEAAVEVFIPVGQARASGIIQAGRTVLVNADDPSRAVASATRAAQGLFPHLHVDVSPLTEVAGPFIRSWRLGITVFSMTGSFAFLLAIGGVYSSVWLFVRQRSAELRVRLTLGARGRHLFGVVFADGAFLTFVGCVGGSILGTVAIRMVRHVMNDISIADAAGVLFVSGFYLATGLGVCALAAARASRHVMRSSGYPR